MARYKTYNYDQTTLLPIRFSKQIIPGTFEYTLSYLIDHELDLTGFDARYNNDKTGCKAYDPAIMLKIILAAYARGINTSRPIERLCRENVIFMALSADTQPHYTTIANFVTQMADVIQSLFTQVLMTCDSLGLIGREMFAIDGCKLPSNASKEHSGTLTELKKKHKKMDRAVRRILKKHRSENLEKDDEECQRLSELKQVETLRKASKRIKAFLVEAEERTGARGKAIKSNVTDNESAKMKTSHGTIQGYNGVAAVDAKHQIILGAEAFGQGPENDLLKPMVEWVKANLGAGTIEGRLTADSGFQHKDNLSYCQEENIDAYIVDGGFRKRDPRFIDRDRYKPKEKRRKLFSTEDFNYKPDANSCYCPAGKMMWNRGGRKIDGNPYVCFTGYLKDCRACPLQAQCMSRPVKKDGRQVSIKVGMTSRTSPSLFEQMKEKVDSDKGRYIYSKRLGTVEPVFGNINTNKHLDRFTLRGKLKVNAQWLMYCLVHNIEKIQRARLAIPKG